MVLLLLLSLSLFAGIVSTRNAWKHSYFDSEMDGILKRFLLYKKTFRLHQKIQFYIWASTSENSNSAPSPKIANPGLEQGLWRIEYLNTGRAKQAEECGLFSLLPVVAQVVANWH